MSATKKRSRVRADRCLSCPNKAISRGLCRTCGDTAQRLIRTGEKTEQDLIDSGMILPPKKAGRPRGDNPFLSQLAKRKARSA